MRMHEQMHVHARWSFDYSFTVPVCPAAQEIDERSVYLAPVPGSCRGSTLPFPREPIRAPW